MWKTNTFRNKTEKPYLWCCWPKQHSVGQILKYWVLNHDCNKLPWNWMQAICCRDTFSAEGCMLEVIISVFNYITASTVTRRYIIFFSSISQPFVLYKNVAVFCSTPDTHFSKMAPFQMQVKWSLHRRPNVQNYWTLMFLMEVRVSCCLKPLSGHCHLIVAIFWVKKKLYGKYMSSHLYSLC